MARAGALETPFLMASLRIVVLPVETKKKPPRPVWVRGPNRVAGSQPGGPHPRLMRSSTTTPTAPDAAVARERELTRTARVLVAFTIAKKDDAHYTMRQEL
jgi:hypothetical protein